MRAFAFFASLSGTVSTETGTSGVPQLILYDNTKIAVAKILCDGRRVRTRVFGELQSHYLFQDRFGGRPGATIKARSKVSSASRGATSRCLYLVFESFAALNAHLGECCR